MFSAALRTALAISFFSAVTVSAAPGLSLHLAGPETVDGVQNLKVVATITNTGDEALKLLNDPRGPLDNMSTDTFAIQNNAGKEPDFVGIRVKYVPSVAVANGKDDAFTVLAPGQSVDVEHDLSNAYNFTSSGSGSYNIQARNNIFYYVNPSDSAVMPIQAQSAAAFGTSISGTLAIARQSTNRLRKRANFNACSSDQQSDINAAIPEAQEYADNAANYLQQLDTSTERFTTWFGEYTASSQDTVQSHFQSMSGNGYDSYTYDCTCTRSGVFGYVYPDDYGTVYFCGAFWTAPTTGSDSKAGTIVHESSHFTANGGTEDFAYGEQDCQALAQNNQNEAINNADSHEYFAENTPPLQ